MRDKWYGDDRDLLKWSVLVHLARAHQAGTILQVLFYVAEPVCKEFKADGQPLEVPAEVWSHFRSVRDIARLKSAIGLDINVFDEPFEHRTRGLYIRKALDQIESMQPHKLVVLLDPDTGIQPSRVGAMHVADQELRSFYQTIKEGDILCLYQHARRDADWLEETRSQFARAIGLDPSEIRTFYRATQRESHPSPVARDIAVLAALKRSQ